MSAVPHALPAYFWWVVLGADVILSAGVLALLRQARLRGPVWWTVALALAAWFAFVLFNGAHHAYVGRGHRVPLIGIQIVAPIAIGYALQRAVPPLRRALLAIPAPSLIGIQALRIVGGVFLLALALRALPPAFALPAGIGDMLVGLSALPVAFALRDGTQSAHRLAILWNAAGLLDLIVAVATGFLSSTNPFRLIYQNPPGDLLSVLPLLMVPAFGVPLFVLLHIASLESLAANSGSNPRVRLAALGGNPGAI